MIINVIHVHGECCIRQMNVKLLSLNENVSRSQKEGVLHLEGVLQLRYSLHRSQINEQVAMKAQCPL